MTSNALEAALDETIVDAPVPRPVPVAPHGATTARQQLLDVRLTSLTSDPDNPREDVGDVTELANSMAAAGLLQPIIARRDDTTGRLLVVAGHRRLAAAQLLGWTTVPVVVRRDMAPDHVLAAMLIENGQRADLDPIEEARALRRLQVQTGGITQSELARRIGRGQMHVSTRLALLSLPVDEQEQVRAGQMTLIEATHRGRIASGKVGKAGQDKNWHLGPQHELATLAKARCQRLDHKLGRRVGGMACGACWESVIRADERRDITDRLIKTGTCPICDTTRETEPVT